MNPYQQALGTRDAVAALTETPQRIRELVEHLPEADFTRANGPDKWTVAQLLEHLAQTEMVYGTRIRMALTHPDYVVQPYDQDQFVGREPQRSGREAFETYYTLRRYNLPLIRSITASERERAFVHPERGPMTVGDLLEQIAGHELHHLAQLEQAAKG